MFHSSIHSVILTHTPRLLAAPQELALWTPATKYTWCWTNTTNRWWRIKWMPWKHWSSTVAWVVVVAMVSRWTKSTCLQGGEITQQQPPLLLVCVHIDYVTRTYEWRSVIHKINGGGVVCRCLHSKLQRIYINEYMYIWVVESKKAHFGSQT